MLQMTAQCIYDPLAGEVHLETVIKDLKERFARIELQVSPPLVAFRESVFLPSESPEAVVKPAKVRVMVNPTCIKPRVSNHRSVASCVVLPSVSAMCITAVTMHDSILSTLELMDCTLSDVACW